MSEADRVETLSGGVPPWTWEELGPRVDGCDALYVNFISGHELGLRDARALRAGFPGPIWADLHSLFLGADGRGVRIPRPLPGAAEWLSCFDAVQMNEDEFDLLEGGEEGVDPVEAGPSLVAVTRGALGAGATAVGAEPMRWREPGRAPRPARTVSLTGRRRAGDPTGCGDVWGATVFARLLAGDELEVAVAQGNRLGGLNVEHRGAGGLAGRFARELAAGGPGSGP